MVKSYHNTQGERIAYLKFINLTAHEIDMYYGEYADEFYKENF